MAEEEKKRTELLTVLVENVMLSKDTGYPEKQGFVLYTAPCSSAMAQALANQLKMVGKSYRIVTLDGKPGYRVVEQWLRPGFVPDDEQLVPRQVKNDE